MGLLKWIENRKEEKLKQELIKQEEEKIKRIEEEIKNARKNGINDILGFDFGASKVKYLLNGKEGEFRSSIRIINDINRITTQPNFIKVNGTWYAIGENQVAPSSQLRKADKEHFEIFMVYCLVKQMSVNGNYDIDMLLPINQFDDKNKIAKIVNGKYDVITTDGKTYQYNLYLNGIYPEGEMSDYYIRQRFSNDNGNRAVGNMGYSTFDVSAFLIGGEQMPTKSYSIAMNKILVEHNQVIQADDTSVLSLWKSQGFIYTEEQTKATRELEKDKVNNLFNDVYAGSLSTLTPNMTTLYICGGGSVAIEHSLKEYINDKPLLNGYEVVVLEGKEALYTDLYGMTLYTKNKMPITITDNKENSTDNILIDNSLEVTKDEFKEVSIDKDENYKNVADNLERLIDKKVNDKKEKKTKKNTKVNLTDKEILVINEYLQNRDLPGHTQDHYAEKLNLTTKQFRYRIEKYEKAHQKDEPNTHNNIIPLTGGR